MTDILTRDHGGAVDRAIAQYGGTPADWLDLSTGINPKAYPLPEISRRDWTTLPGQDASLQLLDAARGFWRVPQRVDILAANGASALIAMVPNLVPAGTVSIPEPTYNEHAAGFRNAGWQVIPELTAAEGLVVVHPNNPDGRLWSLPEMDVGSRALVIIDESFCDVAPDKSLVDLCERPNIIVLKSIGKFWGLAGLRLGFAMGHPSAIAKLRELLGPWPVSGPALTIGHAALSDQNWAQDSRMLLASACQRMDAMLEKCGVSFVGGTDLFRLYRVADAADFHRTLAAHHILCRIFPYSKHWVRLGLPGSKSDWGRLERALSDLE